MNSRSRPNLLAALLRLLFPRTLATTWEAGRLAGLRQARETMLAELLGAAATDTRCGCSDAASPRSSGSAD